MPLTLICINSFGYLFQRADGARYYTSHPRSADEKAAAQARRAAR